MVDLSSLIDESSVLLNVQVDCTKAAFRYVSEAFAERVGVAPRDIAHALNERERMGSTAVGSGVAIPHARLEGLDAPQAIILRLVTPIDMDAPDDALVDVFFVLLVPQEADSDHLRVLSRISRIIRQPENLHAIREAERASEVVALFQES